MVVEGEVEFRGTAKSEACGKLMAEKGRSVIERLERPVGLGIRSLNPDFHVSVAHIRRHVDFRDGDIRQSRIFHFKTDDFR